jgi:hypothetical protein
MLFKENPRRTALVFLPILFFSITYLVLTVRLTLHENDGQVGALLDDTWIHVRFADHVSQGKGLAYNESEITFGATSPLWIFILAGVYVIVNPSVMSQVDIAIVLSAIAYVLSILAVTGFGWWLTRRAWVGFVAGMITVATGRYVWMGLSGMEITTFTLLCLLALWSHLADGRCGRCFGWRTGILTALATLARPEAYLLAILIGFDAFIFIPVRDRLPFIKRIVSGWRGIVSYILLAGMYPFVCLVESGHPLPNTFRAKSQLGREFPELPRAYLWEPNVSHGALLIALMLLGIGFLLWQARHRRQDGIALALWEVLFVLGILMLGAERYVVNHSRYVAPAIPFHALLAAIGVWAISEWVYRKAQLTQLRTGLAVALSGALIVITFTRSYETGMPQVSNDVGQLRKIHVAAGYWVKDHTSSDQLIALNDVGAIVHISDRRVLDLEGLVSPEVIDATQGISDYTCEHDLQLARLMLQDMPRFLLVFDWFYPCLTRWEVAPNAPALQPVREPFKITGPTVIAGGELMVYEPVFENFPVQAFVYPQAISLSAKFEDGIELAAYEANFSATGLEVILWWKAHQQPHHNYYIFVHVIGGDGNILQVMDSQNNLISLQHDSQPQNNQFRTTLWRDGDIIRDPHFIPIPDLSIPYGTGMALRVGVYEFSDGVFRNLKRTDENALSTGQLEFIVIPLKRPLIFGS